MGMLCVAGATELERVRTMQQECIWECFKLCAMEATELERVRAENENALATGLKRVSVTSMKMLYAVKGTKLDRI
jgi:hypothetical protein